MLVVLETCGRLLTAMVAATAPGVRSHHTYGVSDADGFAAMGVAEVFAHMHDVAAGLGLERDPPADICDRADGALSRPMAPGRSWRTIVG